MIEKQFKDNIDRIIKEGRKKGLTRQKICQGVGVSPMTFWRWKRKTPETIKILGLMNDFVSQK